jgi:divalent metal cation (Fe/Co/Zn/Cd) transporter
MPADAEAELRAIVADADGVEEIVDFRTVYFGPKRIVVTADVNFTDGMSGRDIDDAIDTIERALKDADDDIQSVFVEVEKDGKPPVVSGDGSGGSE